jgi:hypothetical protein
MLKVVVVKENNEEDKSILVRQDDNARNFEDLGKTV